MLLILFLAVNYLHILVVSAHEDCFKKDDELRKIIEGVTKQVELKELEGTWMDYMVPSFYLNTVDSSYSTYKLSKDGSEIHQEGHDFLKSNEEDVYDNYFKKREGEDGIKGGFIHKGTYVGGEEFERELYFFYADKDVMGLYSCDPKYSLESGWDLFIIVNADKRKELQEQKDTSEVMKSVNKTMDVMHIIDDQSSTWEEKHEGQFGLLGEMSYLPLDKLEPDPERKTVLPRKVYPNNKMKTNPDNLEAKVDAPASEVHTDDSKQPKHVASYVQVDNKGGNLEDNHQKTVAEHPIDKTDTAPENKLDTLDTGGRTDNSKLQKPVTSDINSKEGKLEGNQHKTADNKDKIRADEAKPAMKV